MTTIDQALLNAIRGVVGEAVAPLGEKIDSLSGSVDSLSGSADSLTGRVDSLSGSVDSLTGRVDDLTGRVDGMSERVDGMSERVDGMSERVDGMSERVDGMSERVDGMSERVDGMSDRVDRIETEQRLQRGLLHSIEESIDERFTHLDLRLTNLEAISMRLENEIGTIETRTGQIFSDVTDLLELQDKVNEGFQSFKSDLQRAFIDIGAVQGTQQGYQRQMKQLRERVDRLERRLSKLESAGGSRE